LPLLFVFLPIGHRGALLDRALTIDCTGAEKDGFGEAGLAGPAVADQSYVSDPGGVYSGHGVNSFYSKVEFCVTTRNRRVKSKILSL